MSSSTATGEQFEGEITIPRKLLAEAYRGLKRHYEMPEVRREIDRLMSLHSENGRPNKGWHNTAERAPEEASIVLGLWYGPDGRPQQAVVVYARQGYWHNEDDDEDDYRGPDYWRDLPETPR